MDSGSTIMAALLPLAALAFLALHAADAALPLLRRTAVRESLPEKGIRAGAVRLLRMKRSAYEDVVWLLTLLSVAAVTGFALGVMLRGVGARWPVTVAALFALWAFLVLLVPVVERVVRRMNLSQLATFGALIQLGLYPLLPLRGLSQQGLRLMGGARQTAVEQTAAPAVPDSPPDQVSLEEAITDEPLAPREREMMRGILYLEETAVREIMVPRVDIASVDVETALPQVTARMVESAHSRLPVYEGTPDNIIGMLFIRDLLAAVGKEPAPANLRPLLRPCFFVPESKRLDELLAEFQARRVSIAVVVDEYGGIAGLVTVEDLLEEIVGEIEDEFEKAQRIIERSDAGYALVDARISIKELNEALAAHVEVDEYETLGGYLSRALGRIPVAGDALEAGGLRVEVVSTVGRRVKRVRVEPLGAAEPEPADAASTRSQATGG